MLRTDGKVILGVLLILPTLLCFVGAGALLHVAVRASAAKQEQAHQRIEDQLEKDRQTAEQLSAAVEEVERQIQQIRKRLAELQAAEHCQAELARLQTRKEELQAQLSSLRGELEKLERRLGVAGEECDDLRHKVAEARRKRDELHEQLAAMAPSSKGDSDGDPQGEEPSPDELKACIAQVEHRLQDQKRKNEQAQAEWHSLQQQPADDSRIAVGEIRGTQQWQPPPNPLYVECDGNGILLQPETVRLAAEPGEEERGRFVDVARRRGYVLFLIRPDGFKSFRQYRSLISGEVDFGYEPIKQHARVIYPERS